MLLEGRAQELRLLLAHQAVIHVDAGEPVPDRAVDERRGDGGVHAARQGADDLAVRPDRAGVVVDPGPDVGDRRFDEVRGRPVGRAPAIPTTKFRRTSLPRGVCTTSGWNWIP